MTPAAMLKGMTLDNGWQVIDLAIRRPDATGGHFSQGYTVQNSDGRRGFLKAIDYQKALIAPNAADLLQAMTAAFIFERDLCQKCGHLTRVARAIDSGSVVPGGSPYNRVDYIIFELAEKDVRAHLSEMATLDEVFVLKTLHHVAIGLQQLHKINVAHQDLKPSNVLLYAGQVGTKICDLGRGWDPSLPMPHNGLPIAGQTSYAPIDFLYGATPPDELSRRFGCDLYHLGNLISFFFTQAQINSLIVDALNPTHRPGIWAGNYVDILPYVQLAFESALNSFTAQISDYLKDELRRFIFELCNPDPRKRGDPKNCFANRHSLERYISRFDYLALKAELLLIGRRQHA